MKSSVQTASLPNGRGKPMTFPGEWLIRNRSFVIQNQGTEYTFRTDVKSYSDLTGSAELQNHIFRLCSYAVLSAPYT